MEASPLVADLHSHTTVSDGSFTLETLTDAAQRADLDWVAVTDHDRIHPDIEAPVVERQVDSREKPLRLIRGIELRVKAGDQRVDLLGYGVERTDALVAESNRLQQNRKDRAGEIVECVDIN
jgi:Predicted metal-dependent phosphoesterases (PHP family)